MTWPVPAVPPSVDTHRAPDRQDGPASRSQASPSSAFAAQVPGTPELEATQELAPDGWLWWLPEPHISPAAATTTATQVLLVLLHTKPALRSQPVPVLSAGSHV